MSASIRYSTSLNGDGEEVVWAHWTWPCLGGKKDGRICATSNGATNPLSNAHNYVVMQLDGEAVTRDVSNLSSCKDLPLELRWKSSDGYNAFGHAFDLFKSRIRGAPRIPETTITIPDSAPEVADPHAGQVYNPITEKWSWGF